MLATPEQEKAIREYLANQQTEAMVKKLRALQEEAIRTAHKFDERGDNAAAEYYNGKMVGYGVAIRILKGQPII